MEPYWPDDHLGENLGHALGQVINAAGSSAPLQQRNLTRAKAGAFVLVGCAVLAAHGFPVIGWKVTAGVAAFALLYLGVGIHGARGSARIDLMSVFWSAVLVVIAGAALVFFEFKGGLPL